MCAGRTKMIWCKISPPRGTKWAIGFTQPEMDGLGVGKRSGSDKMGLSNLINTDFFSLFSR